MRQDGRMPVLRALGRTAAVTAVAAARLATGGLRTGRFFARNVGVARRRGGAGEAGMMRLLDLHAASCAGDTLVAIGLAGTVFFAVPVGEARGRVALYLLVTMLPFALLAPVVGPVLDRFRHGRRYALALTMLGRAFLAYVIAEHIGGFTLYPAAFGMLVLSRAYGVARSAAVPRLLPEHLGLSEAGARASVFGTLAGAVAVPFGIAANALGPQWPLRLSMAVFVAGMVVSLRLPPRADAQPPEVVPRLFQLPGRKGTKVLSGRLVVASLAGSATLRALYGFLALFAAFSIRAGELPTRLPGWTVPRMTAIGLVAGALAVGSFLATAVGTTLRIRRPALLQAGVVVLAAVAAVAAAARYTLLLLALVCLATAVASGLAKLTVDAVIQEKIPERVRASAFAHAETLLMLAWVAGAGLGLIPFGGRLGLAVVAVFAVLAAGRAVMVAARLRGERLRGAAAPEEEPETAPVTAPAARAPTASRPLPAPTGQRPARTRRLWSRGRGPGGRAEATTRVLVEDEAGTAPAGFHLYRPDPTRRLDPDGPDDAGRTRRLDDGDER
jgi:MFS family permease